MRGVVFLGNRKIELREFPDPAPGPGDVVLAIKASGMCGSDLHPYRAAGNAAAALGLGGKGEPVIAGHEPCGVIAAVGPGVPAEQARVGQRVMNHHYRGCGECKHCRVGWSQLCRRGITVYGMTGHGGHAPFMKVPARTNVPLPDELSFEEGAAVACGTGTAYGALKRLDVSGRDTLAVFGQGPVGLSATMLGVAMGARVIAIDPRGRWR
jgi:D-arabinose 1-dehydrogenase-like Zn-dependent alcohol dehydrogenase